MAVTKAGGRLGGRSTPPFANKMICITLPYKGHQYTDHQLAIQLLLQEIQKAKNHGARNRRSQKAKKPSSQESQKAKKPKAQAANRKKAEIK